MELSYIATPSYNSDWEVAVFRLVTMCSDEKYISTYISTRKDIGELGQPGALLTVKEKLF